MNVQPPALKPKRDSRVLLLLPSQLKADIKDVAKGKNMSVNELANQVFAQVVKQFKPR